MLVPFRLSPDIISYGAMMSACERAAQHLDRVFERPQPSFAGLYFIDVIAILQYIITIHNIISYYNMLSII